MTMKNSRLLTALLVLGIIVTPILARADEAAVKREIMAEFARVAAALKKKDVKGYMTSLSADYTAKAPTGQTITRQQMEQIMTAQLSQVKSIDSVTYTIQKLSLKGKEAVADATMKTTLQIVDAQGQMGPKGKAHVIVQEQRNRDTFVKSGAGWKMKMSEIQPGAKVTLDGKPLGAGGPGGGPKRP